MIADMDTNRCGVYAIRNVVDGKNTTYIGSTHCSFNRRWRDHRNSLTHGDHRNCWLQRSWNKYGEIGFEFLVLEYCEKDQNIIKQEQKWLDEIRKDVPVFNLGDIVDAPFRGKHLSEAHRAKMSMAKIGKKRKPYTEETLRKISLIRKGKHHTEEARTKMRIAHTGKKLSESHRLLLATHMAKNRERRVIDYPGFVNVDGRCILPGRNFNEMCREYGLSQGTMHMVLIGLRNHHKGWSLRKDVAQC